MTHLIVTDRLHFQTPWMRLLGIIKFCGVYGLLVTIDTCMDDSSYE